ncbi:26662_t:CDS:2, partial [Gigaspora margarita]
IAVIACSLALIVVLLPFIGLENFELPIAANATLNGFPTWHIDIPACVHYGGKITAIKYWVWVLRYFIVVIIGCVWLDWPYDALWYQVQAQSIEVLIVITFIRLYFTTRRNLHEYENHLPPNTEQDNSEPGDQSEDTIPQEPSSEYHFL